jgi:hypothetical protein
MDHMQPPSPPLEILALGLHLDVTQRLVDLKAWMSDWQTQDRRLLQQLRSLDPSRRSDVLLGSQIASLRRQLALRVTRQPVHR